MTQATTINAEFLVQNLQHFLLNAPCITEQHHKVLREEDIVLGDNGNRSIISDDLRTVINSLFKMNQRQLGDTHPPGTQGNRSKGLFLFAGADKSTVYLCVCKICHSAFCTNLYNCIQNILSTLSL